MGVFGTVPATQVPRSPKRRSKATAPCEAVGVDPTMLEAARGANATTPKTRARDATIAKARRGGVPLKVKLPDYLNAVVIRGFDPCLPIKKRSVFGDIAGPEDAAALQHLEPDMPVKKRLPSFFFEEPLRAIRAPPGLESIAPSFVSQACLSDANAVATSVWN